MECDWKTRERRGLMPAYSIYTRKEGIVKRLEREKRDTSRHLPYMESCFYFRDCGLVIESCVSLPLIETFFINQSVAVVVLPCAQAVGFSQ